jgi:phosphohistidine swiveling domain-containing protein
MEIADKIDFNREWTRKGFHGILHTFFPVGEQSLKELRDYYGDSFSLTLFFVSDDYVNWYWNNEDMERLRKSLVKRVAESPGFLDTLVSDWHERLEDFQEAAVEVDHTDLSRLGDRELIDLYGKLYSAYVREYALSIGLQDSFSLHAYKFLIPRIEEFLDGEGLRDYLVEYTSILTAPVNESFITQRRRELLKMLELIQKSKMLQEIFSKGIPEIEKVLLGHTELNSMLEKHTSEFFWVQNNYAKMIILEKRFFIEELKRMLEEGILAENELPKLDKQIPHTKEMKEKLMEDLKVPNDIRILIRIAEVFTYIQDERKKYVLISNHYQKLFLDEIGKRLGLTSGEMAYTHFRELEDFLINGKVDREKLSSRKRHCLCIHTLDGYQVLDGRKVDDIFDKHFTIKSEGISEVRGMSASKGRAKGIVKIVKKTHDLVNVEKGDILVADMTRPEMVVAMEKAAAIVTDEGGITSHAAIVSRELGIPCIVGTKIATTVFQNGDLVEVDADNGIVKKNV